MADRQALRVVPFLIALLVAFAAASAGVAAASTGSPTSPSIYLTKVVFDGCDTLVYGYSYNGSEHTLNTNAGHECAPYSVANVVNSIPSDANFSNWLIWLRDDSCSGAKYFDDGTGDADHATTGTGTKHRTVDIADAGGGCSNQSSTVTPTRGNGNLSLVEARH
jgi:hypothetical protein